jgi:hypothetical protein
MDETCGFTQEQWTQLNRQLVNKSILGPVITTFVARDARLGNVAVYKVTTKILSEIIAKKQKVPHTNIHYWQPDEFDSAYTQVVWIRRTELEDLKQAIATLLMMGKEPVVLRAFEP